MLSDKHANIGNTVGMLKEIHELTTNPKIANSISELFMAESDDCDYKNLEYGLCSYYTGDSPADLWGAAKCMAGNCPLSNIVDLEIDGNDLDFGCNPDDFPMLSRGGHIHIGYTGWRKYWNIVKRSLKTFWADRWIFLKIALVVYAVAYGSKLAGYYSTYLW